MIIVTALRRATFKSYSKIDYICLDYNKIINKYVSSWVDSKGMIKNQEIKDTRAEAEQIYDRTLEQIKKEGRLIKEENDLDIDTKSEKEDKMVEKLASEELIEKTIELQGNNLVDPNKPNYLPPELQIMIPKPEYYLDTGYLKGIGYGVKENRPVLIQGETGCGKTSGIRYLAHLTKNPYIRINLNGSTTADEFVGKWRLDGGSMVWMDGLLTEAVRRGIWLVCDEVNAALPEILFVLQSLLDDERQLTLTQKDGEKIVAHPNFRFFATMNNRYEGTHRLNQAFKNRFKIVKMKYPKLSDEVQIITNRTNVPEVAKDKKLVTRMVTVARKIREEFKANKITTTFSTRTLIDWANAMKYFTPAQAYYEEVLGQCEEEEENIFKDVAATIFPEPEFRNTLELKLDKKYSVGDED